jgi:hypothetical protein
LEESGMRRFLKLKYQSAKAVIEDEDLHENSYASKKW